MSNRAMMGPFFLSVMEMGAADAADPESGHEPSLTIPASARLPAGWRGAVVLPLMLRSAGTSGVGRFGKGGWCYSKMSYRIRSNMWTIHMREEGWKKRSLEVL